MPMNLKLFIPNNKFEAIEKWIISKGGVRCQHLQAAYIDTPDLLLTLEGVELCLIKEGRQWVQTLKIVTDNSLARHEYDLICKVIRKKDPNWDLDRDLGHESWHLLKERFPKLKVQELQICYRTDIWRRKALFKSSHGVFQCTLDRGTISTLFSNGTRAEPIQALEIQLIKGEPRIVLNHAQKMIKNYGVFIGTCNKNEYVFSLGSRVELSPPVKAKHIPLKGAGDICEIITRLIDSCMYQVLTNQSALNAQCQNSSVYLHQLRVGLRRLKVLFKYLAKYDVQISDNGIEIFNRVFSLLGQYRNNDYVTDVLNPTLLSLGSSEIKLDDIAALPNPARITSDKDFQLLLIELMSFTLSQTTPIAQSVAGQKNKESIAIFKKTLFKLLNSRFQFLADRAPNFSRLRVEEIHLMRKKMKFIRYSLEFFKDYCIKKPYQNFFSTLTTTLDYFGLFNDICVTIDRIERSTKNDSNLLFALDWLRSRQKRIHPLCGKGLKKLIQTETPWES